MHKQFHGRLRTSSVPPAPRGWPCACCPLLLRACRRPKRCQAFCTHPVPPVQLNLIGVMHSEVLVLVCSSICSSHFSSVSGVIDWWKTVCRKKLMDFGHTHKELPPRHLCLSSLCSSSTCSEPQGWLLVYKWDSMSCP